jgi:hypothetical protein
MRKAGLEGRKVKDETLFFGHARISYYRASAHP